MWILLATIVLCLTIIMLFRMYIDLRRNDNMHARSLHRDTQDFQRYTAITSRPVQKPAMPDFGRALEASRVNQADVRYWQEDEQPRVPTLAELRQAEEMIRYKKALIDPRLLTEAMRQHIERDRRELGL